MIEFLARPEILRPFLHQKRIDAIAGSEHYIFPRASTAAT
jgi:hypothetical protein